MARGDFRIDHTVKSKWSSMPQEGSPHRCQVKKRDGTQCRNWQRRGDDFCDWHRKKFKSRKTGASDSFVYQRQAKKVLSDLIETAVNEGVDTLEDEIAVARALCMKAVSICAAALELGEDNTGVKLKSMVFAQDALTHVSKLLEKQSKIKALSAVTPEQLDRLQSNIINVLRANLLPEHEDVFTKITNELSKISAPKSDVHILID